MRATRRPPTRPRPRWAAYILGGSAPERGIVLEIVR